MKKNLLILAVLLLSIADSYSQETFSTGAMDVYVGTYGKIRLYTPDGIEHLHRATILVGTSSSAVFDHENDAEVVDATTLVASPLQSDFEIYGAYDNSYSGAPPAVLVKLNAYGWTGQAYTIVRFNIKNNETTTINALQGLEILPYLNETYGYDTVTYNSEEGVIRFHRGIGVNMGMKLLSASLSSLYSFEYYDSYQVDADFWNWMNHGSLQPQYISTTADGPVTITSQASVSIAPGETYNAYYAMALGSTEQNMLANISAAKLKYEDLTTSVGENPLGGIQFKNYPNPVKSSTTFSYQLPEAGFVSLKIYDALGNERAVLVNSKQAGGLHTINFNADDLASGVYTSKLWFNDHFISNKMMLIK
jgi:hypothetical protein